MKDLTCFSFKIRSKYMLDGFIANVVAYDLDEAEIICEENIPTNCTYEFMETTSLLGVSDSILLNKVEN